MEGAYLKLVHASLRGWGRVEEIDCENLDGQNFVSHLLYIHQSRPCFISPSPIDSRSSYSRKSHPSPMTSAPKHRVRSRVPLSGPIWRSTSGEMEMGAFSYHIGGFRFLLVDESD